MAKALTQWTVLPHRPLERLSPTLMTVTGDLRMPLSLLERHMTVTRLNDGRLVIFSAMALDEPQMREPRLAKRVLVKDAHALRAQLEAWAAQPVERLLVSHGQPILAAAQEALREMASSL